MVNSPELEAAIQRSKDIIDNIAVINLVGYADIGTHFRRGPKDFLGSSLYVTPTGAIWQAYFVGKILPASYGTRHCPTGSVQVRDFYSLNAR